MQIQTLQIMEKDRLLQTIDDNVVLLLRQSTSLINAALIHLINDDEIGVCRIQGVAGSVLHKADCAAVGCQAVCRIYISMLRESVEMLLDSSREIVCGAGLSLWQKCELDFLRHDLFETDCLDKESFGRTKDFLSHIIKSLIKTMDNDCRSYQYLRLLQNLRIAAICQNKIMLSNPHNL